ncbi:MAG: DNA polymerase III subunit alpha [Proteobacteria bacterium]|nr:DNA polymerase III subunit alpha [Pseudomonadota bacterium]
MKQTFVHLHLRSEYSIVDSIIQVGALCDEVKANEMPAVAITDICNLFAMVKFYKAAINAGIKPIIGTELWVQEDKSYYKLVLLCQNWQGYQNLNLLISKAYQLGEHLEVPLVKREWVFEHASGLIALSGAQFGEVGMHIVNNAHDKAKACLSEWMKVFDNRYYLELQRNGKMHEKDYEKGAILLSQELHCPLVATNETVFLHKDDYEAHLARVCIQEGTTLEAANKEKYSQQQYFRSAKEMCELFADLPEALLNTVEIAKRCSLSLTLDKSVLPTFPVPGGFTEDTFLRKASEEGLEKRLAFKNKQKHFEQAQWQEINRLYHERLSTELSVISEMGFPGYFLIVADFIQWAKTNQIPVGPGRGSGAGSLVAYALAITDLDPMDYDLLFERFLNPERVSMPDFDIDFCMDNRDRVIEYVAKKYGRNSVSQIATFGTMAAKAVVRDVGRVLGHPYGFVDKIAKLIPFEIGITLEKALQQEQVLKARFDEEEEVRSLITLAQKLEGITRNVGKHAGGVVIAPSNLTDFAPLYCEKDSEQVVIQFDKDDVEAIGLTKFDFLGLRTLTIIDWAVQNANALLKDEGKPLIDIQSIPLDDTQTFQLLKNCATTAVFQLESRGMKELIKRLQPDQFEEIIALVALFRPGPLQSGMVDDFINRKHGRAKVEYAHPAIEPILKPTYGVILYQEQVMQIAQVLAGYTLGGADLLRRAMGKKKPEEMAKQRTIFVEGAVLQGVQEKTATYIFDLMEKFAGYGFNKSHSAAYALVSYQTAWLKAHYPSPFMAAVLSADMNNTDKIVNLVEECKHCQIKVIPPNIHFSNYMFTVNKQNEIIYGLGAIKGVGEAAIQDIIEERQRKPFSSFFEFCERIDGKKVNKRVIESLIKSGALDSFGFERSQLMAQMDEALARAEQLSKNLSYGQTDLFADQEASYHPQDLPQVKPWTAQERLLGEKESLGMYLSGHPLESFDAELRKMGIIKFREIQVAPKDQKVIVAGLIIAIRSLQTKNGDRMAIVTIDDRLDRFEITVFPDPYQKFREYLTKDQLIIVEALAGNDSFSGGLKVKAQNIFTLAKARETFAKKVKISFMNKMSDEAMLGLKTYLENQEKGECPIYIQFQNDKANAQIKLDPRWNIKPTENALTGLKESLNYQVELEY